MYIILRESNVRTLSQMFAFTEIPVIKTGEGVIVNGYPMRYGESLKVSTDKEGVLKVYPEDAPLKRRMTNELCNL